MSGPAGHWPISRASNLKRSRCLVTRSSWSAPTRRQLVGWQGGRCARRTQRDNARSWPGRVGAGTGSGRHDHQAFATAGARASTPPRIAGGRWRSCGSTSAVRSSSSVGIPAYTTPTRWPCSSETSRPSSADRPVSGAHRLRPDTQGTGRQLLNGMSDALVARRKVWVRCGLITVARGGVEPPTFRFSGARTAVRHRSPAFIAGWWCRESYAQLAELDGNYWSIAGSGWQVHLGPLRVALQHPQRVAHHLIAAGQPNHQTTLPGPCIASGHRYHARDPHRTLATYSIT